ncbi:MAG: hypothetical protein KJ970_07115 [Candidatus Eisenbacteria bacterium]|uniref:FeoB-associated Cys-rich membrane protein n=1 Tax=Eiseniibacteriota bacterium TaxID=2212470 RepID=A0A948WC81_UNCEI|nr:hypothetical protein [Candidatus Eisenbacteria bacterium]MBU1950227.1 hypothetical protein [Candidatus Eisenbacteria bacterium]MBU2690683.1 hypothetical protein [Candidatus Eisenbacteria bacterium]
MPVLMKGDMPVHILAIIGLAVLCSGWIIVQRFISRHDPEAPTIERNCGCCGEDCTVDDDGKTCRMDQNR